MRSAPISATTAAWKSAAGHPSPRRRAAQSPYYFSSDNVLVVTFGEEPENDTNAYQALTELKQLDSQGQIKVAGAAVVTRDPDDRVDVKSEVANDPYEAEPLRRRWW